jgi:hypothetical protein
MAERQHLCTVTGPTETMALELPQSQRRQLIFMDDVIADHAAVDTPPPMKTG